MPAEQILERLMREYGDSVFRMCYLYLKDYYLAEDATQETFIKAMKSYDSFLHNSKEKTWLIRIAINSCKNIMRTRWFRFPMLSIEEQQYLDICKSLEDVVIEKDTVSKAIMSLNKSDRELIILYYYQELSVKEISLITKKKENAINQRLRRARERLKDYLKEEQYEG